MKLLIQSKKICYNYKTQDHSLAAINKITSAFFSTKQKDNELVVDYVIYLNNRLAFYKAVGGNLINEGVRSFTAEDLFKKPYTVLSMSQKSECVSVRVEKVLAMVLIMNTDNKHFENRRMRFMIII